MAMCRIFAPFDPGSLRGSPHRQGSCGEARSTPTGKPLARSLRHANLEYIFLLSPRLCTAATMSGKEVIRAAQMFTTNGAAAKVSVVKEIAIGLTLGISAGLVWQVS